MFENKRFVSWLLEDLTSHENNPVWTRYGVNTDSNFFHGLIAQP